MASRLRLAIVAVVVLLAAAPPLHAQADRGAYRIRSFDTHLTIEANSDVIVEERLDVVFREPRHGIFRTIPVRYSDPKGFAYSLDFRLLEVGDGQGGEHQVDVSNQGRYVRLRIGDPDREVNGQVTYVIRYRVRDALSQFPEHDEIYWNATGNEWNATIDSATATVTLPVPMAVDGVQAAGYTGAFGEAGRDVSVDTSSPGVVRFVATRSLAPLEGLTIAVGFPHGLVTFPSAGVRAARMAVDNWVALLPLVWLGYVVRQWRRSGRDPEGDASVVVNYEPPPDLSPGEIGTLIDERVDIADITATIVDLAVRGHLRIETVSEERMFGLWNSEDTSFTRLPDPPDDLREHESALLTGMFGNSAHVQASDLKNKFYSHIPTIQRTLYTRLAGHGYFDKRPDQTRTNWTVGGMFAGVATGAVAAGWLSLRGVGVPASVLIPIGTGLVTLLIFIIAARTMPRRTRKGVAARQWALGFEEFVTRVESDRMRMELADPRAAFERLLPYAMALGVAGEWASRFDDIYKAGNGPSWYVGPHGTHGGFAATSLERNLTGAMAATSRSMTASPRSSSGSGGGGSSGGGGGGGGGGSW